MKPGIRQSQKYSKSIGKLQWPAAGGDRDEQNQKSQARFENQRVEFNDKQKTQSKTYL